MVTKISTTQMRILVIMIVIQYVYIYKDLGVFEENVLAIKMKKINTLRNIYICTHSILHLIHIPHVSSTRIRTKFYPMSENQSNLSGRMRK